LADKLEARLRWTEHPVAVEVGSKCSPAGRPQVPAVDFEAHPFADGGAELPKWGQATLIL
jgi:hypothetical protein